MISIARRAAAFTIFGMATLGAPVIADEANVVRAPTFKPGDTWVFDQTTEKGAAGYGQLRLDLTVERLDSDGMVVGIKRDGAPTEFEDHAVGLDWSQHLLAGGEQKMKTRPLNFPMSIGQSWNVDYVDATRRGAQLSDHVRRTYTVVGWEDVTVPAGTFHAIKVEAKGVDEATIEIPAAALGGAVASSSGATTITQARPGGRGALTRVIRSEFYYVPVIKNFVKSVEEQYDADDVRVSRETRALVSFKPAA